MRLTLNQIAQIHQTVRTHFDGDTGIWLFGSALDDQARGGDIDLYIEPGGSLPTNLLLARQALERDLERRLQRSVDVVIGRQPLTAFMRQARAEGRRL